MHFKRPTLLLASLAASALVLSGCVGAPETNTDASASAGADSSYQSVEITNCGFAIEYDQPPKKAITLNQGATEVMLALGLEDSMVGTAYIDDEISEKWQAAYDSVPVLSDKYPDKETFLSAEPDFAYASFTSAFSDKVAGDREELKGQGINSYLSVFYCPEDEDKLPGTIENVWLETREIAKIFGVEDRAEQLIADQQAQMDEIKNNAAGNSRTVMWYDSGDKTPFVGTGGGSPQVIMDLVGLDNIFADADKNSSWADGSWETVVEADPDVIVLADAAWSSADEKIAYLEADPVLSQLTAVKNRAYVTLLFSESVSGIKLVDGAAKVNEQLAELD